MHCKMICAPLDSSRRELSIGTKIVENDVMGTKLGANLVGCLTMFCIVQTIMDSCQVIRLLSDPTALYLFASSFSMAIHLM